MRWLERVGLGYIAVGQSLDTLSGGEKQRLLLAKHLSGVEVKPKPARKPVAQAKALPKLPES